eukprot:jgi/Psemu1/2421/gm1.2421_g
MAGELNSSQQILLQCFTLPKLDPDVTLPSLGACVFQAPCCYNIILRRNILCHFKIVLNFHENLIKSTKQIIPMRTFPRLLASPAALTLQIHALQIDTSHQTQPNKSLAVTDNKTAILNSTYDQDNPQQYDQLHTVLCKYQIVFDGNLKHYLEEEIHLDISPTVKPHCSCAYPVPHAQLTLFKKELNCLVNIGILSSIQRKVYPIPRIQDILSHHSGYKYLSKMDISMQYYISSGNGLASALRSIESWDTSKVKYMHWMFKDSSFNLPIGSWDAFNIEVASLMVGGSSFNQPIGSWSTSTSLKNMLEMFEQSLFNQPHWIMGHWKGYNYEGYVSMFHKNNSAEVLMLETFSAKTYFEVKGDSDVSMELFYNVAQGKLPFVTSYAAEYTIPDAKSTQAYTGGVNNTGTVILCKWKACVRASKKLDYDDSTAGSEYASSVDHTFMMVKVDFAAKFQNFTEAVSIASVENGILTTIITKNIDEESLLCASGRPPDFAYMMGEKSGICVHPTQKCIDETYYYVTSFKQVVCFKNSG